MAKFSTLPSRWIARLLRRSRRRLVRLSQRIDDGVVEHVWLACTVFRKLDHFDRLYPCSLALNLSVHLRPKSLSVRQECLARVGDHRDPEESVASHAQME
jgi:hypothetical protein